MKKLIEYYDLDFAKLTLFEKELAVSLENERISFPCKIRIDFDGGIKYPIIYLKSGTPMLRIIKSIIDKPIIAISLERIKEIRIAEAKPHAEFSYSNLGDGKIEFTSEGFTDGKVLASSLQFSKKIIFYTEHSFSLEEKTDFSDYAKSKDITIAIRDNNYLYERRKHEKPIAFISHASSDKKIAKEIALEMAKYGEVWYDEFSLKVGDSLKDNIEKGIKECKNCILLLTPNFLNKGGWTKMEYDSIFTREMIENKKIILPIWSNVQPEEVYKYSPVLADRVAVNFDIGVEEVCLKLMKAIDF